MTYRDEKEGLRVRVAELQRELDEAKSTVAKLRGDGATSSSGPRGRYSGLLGLDTQFVLDRTLPFEMSTEGYEAVAALMKSRFGVAASQVGRQLDAGGLSISYADGRTRVRWAIDRRPLELSLVSLTGLLGVFGAMVPVSIGHDGFHLSDPQLWAVFGVSLIAATCGIGLGLRSWFKKQSRTKAREASAAFERVVEIATEHAVRNPEEDGPRMRVDVADDGRDAIAETEAELVALAEQTSARSV